MSKGSNMNSEDRWIGEVPNGNFVCRNCFGDEEWKEWFNERAKEEDCPCSFECLFESFDRVPFEKFVERSMEILRANFEKADGTEAEEERKNRYDLAEFIADDGKLQQKLRDALYNLLADLTWVGK